MLARQNERYSGPMLIRAMVSRRRFGSSVLPSSARPVSDKKPLTPPPTSIAGSVLATGSASNDSIDAHLHEARPDDEVWAEYVLGQTPRRGEDDVASKRHRTASQHQFLVPRLEETRRVPEVYINPDHVTEQPPADAEDDVGTGRALSQDKGCAGSRTSHRETV